MNALVQITTLQTMSSREIAELTDKRHPDVKRDIETMCSQLSLDVSKFAHIYLDSMNRQQTEYLLDKELSICLVAGYSAPLRMAIIQRWQELEAQVQPVDPMKALSDPLALRGLLLDYSEKVIELEETITAMKPDVKALERLSKTEGSLCLTDAAKHMQMRPKDLILWMSQNRYIYRRAGNSHWVAYQYHITCGNLEHKVTEITHSNGSSRFTEQVRVIPKGFAYMSQIMVLQDMVKAASSKSTASINRSK